MTHEDITTLLRRWYGLNAGTAFQWDDGEPPWGCVVFADAKEEIGAIEKAMEKLSKREQDVLKLLYFEDIPTDEAAKVLCISKEAVMKADSSGIDKITEALEGGVCFQNH